MAYWHFFIHIASLRKYWSFIKCGLSIQYCLFQCHFHLLFELLILFVCCLFDFAFWSVYTWCHIGSETVWPRNKLSCSINFLERRQGYPGNGRDSLFHICWWNWIVTCKELKWALNFYHIQKSTEIEVLNILLLVSNSTAAKSHCQDQCQGVFPFWVLFQVLSLGL